jgi:YcxB-like protein
MQIEYEIKPSDHLELLRKRYRSQRPVVTFGLAVLGLLWGLGIYAGAGMFHLGMIRSLSAWIIGVSIFIIAVELLGPYLVHWRIYGRNRRLFGTRRVTFNEDGIIADTPSGHVESAWTKSEGFRETKNLFLIYATADVASLIPKRSFQSQAELDEFRALLARKLRRL